MYLVINYFFFKEFWNKVVYVRWLLIVYNVIFNVVVV